MKTLLALSIFLQVYVCSNYSIPNENWDLKEGIYYGKLGKLYERHIFLKISNDTAIADLFVKEHNKYKIFTDTLIISKDQKTANGIFSTIVNDERDVYIIPKSQNSPFQFKKIKVTMNNEKLRQWEIFKNVAYMEKENGTFYDNSKNNEVNISFRKLLMEYKISEKANKLSHEDFVKEYEKVKQKMQLIK